MIQTRLYVLDRRLYAMLQAYGVSLVCYTCGKALKVGDKVVGRKSFPCCRSKRRHVRCAKRIGMI